VLRAVKLSLGVQIVLTVAALVVAGVAMGSETMVSTQGRTVTGGVVVSAPIIVCGLLLLVAGTAGLVALRLRRGYLRSSIILCAPLALAVASSLSALPEDGAGEQTLFAYGVQSAIEKTLRLLEFSSWLLLAAVLLSSVSALLLFLLRRRLAVR
jgi:hypothetical protein